MNIKDIDNLTDLKAFIKSKGIKVVPKKSSELFGYLGLHYEIGDDFGFRIAKNTILIDENLTGREYFRTLKHEVEEMLLMKEKDWSYMKAHKKALADEVVR